MRTLVRWVRHRVQRAALEPFEHAPYPLEHTLEHTGDPGLFAPGAVTWKVIGDPVAIYGGIRGLLVQAAHPEVVAGVADHSRYQEDPLGRLSRTSGYVNATAFGAMPEVEAAVATVRRRHRTISGTSHRGIGYTADDPGLSAWVHNALVDGLLATHQTYSKHPLTDEEADRFVVEQQRVGALLDSDPMPSRAASLHAWIEEHPDLAPAPGMTDAVEFLRRPPLPLLGQRLGYRVIFDAVLATVPPRIRRILGVRRHPGGIVAGKALAGVLRWTLGSSPSWRLALDRVGAPYPEEARFIQPPAGRRNHSTHPSPPTTR